MVRGWLGPAFAFVGHRGGWPCSRVRGGTEEETPGRVGVGVFLRRPGSTLGHLNWGSLMGG